MPRKSLADTYVEDLQSGNDHVCIYGSPATKPVHVDRYIAALKGNTGTKYLGLDYVATAAMTRVVEILPETMVETFSFSCQRTPAHYFKCFASSLPKCESLRKLRLQMNTLKVPHLDYIMTGVAQSKIKYLDLACGDVENVVWSCLAKTLSQCPSITDLGLDVSINDLSLKVMSKAFLEMPSLTKLNLKIYSGSISTETWLSFAPVLSKVKELTIDGISIRDDAVYSAFLAAVVKTPSKLEVLKIEGFQMVMSKVVCDGWIHEIPKSGLRELEFGGDFRMFLYGGAYCPNAAMTVAAFKSSGLRSLTMGSKHSEIASLEKLVNSNKYQLMLMFLAAWMIPRVSLGELRLPMELVKLLSLMF